LYIDYPREFVDSEGNSYHAGGPTEGYWHNDYPPELQGSLIFLEADERKRIEDLREAYKREYIREYQRLKEEYRKEYIQDHYSLVPSYDWAPGTSIGVGILTVNIACAIILVHYLRLHKENMVPWITGMILCTPVLTLIMYLLTWPSERVSK